MTAVAPPRVPVLMYHEIADVTVTQSKLAVSPEVFADQIAYLSDAGFTAVTAGALAAMLADGGQGIPERPVVVTFDDGYGDFYENAFPVLKQYGFTSTVFVTTGWIGLEDKVKRMLRWSELSEAAEAGVEIGAHTCKHPQLDQIPGRQVHEELCTCKSLLEDKLGQAVPGLAYPFGYSNERVRESSREAGYAYGYAVGNYLATTSADTFAIPRITIRRATTMDSFRRLVGGEQTLSLRRDRALTQGFSVVRRALSVARSAGK